MTTRTCRPGGPCHGAGHRPGPALQRPGHHAHDLLNPAYAAEMFTALRRIGTGVHRLALRTTSWPTAHPFESRTTIT
ncbi:hypothetical protein ACFVT1_40800 [Streptomyces sp. NPDC057963]|uniref:hypothetical protein n=1 Tax=Streptomyces sp. NPDC057963 TaxID=3346290 RepID=UPI0036E0CB3C